MIKKKLNDYVIAPLQEEAVNEAINEVKKKFISIQKEMIIISISVLLVMSILPLILTESLAKILSGITLWGALIYTIYHIIESKEDILKFIKLLSFEKFIYQKMYDEVRKEVDERLEKRLKIENKIFDMFSDGKALMAHKITSKAHDMSKKIIYTNTGILIILVVLYNLIRNYLAYHDYHMSILGLMIYPFDLLLK